MTRPITLTALITLAMTTSASAATPPGVSRSCKDLETGNRQCTIKAGTDLEFDLVFEPDGHHTFVIAKQVDIKKAKYRLKGGNSGGDCYVIISNESVFPPPTVFVSPKDGSFVEDWTDAKCDLSLPMNATGLSPKLAEKQLQAIENARAALKRLSDQVDAKSVRDKSECLRTFSDDAYCECVVKHMPVGGSFAQFLRFVTNVAADTRGFRDDQLGLTKDQRGVADGFSRVRAECTVSGK